MSRRLGMNHLVGNVGGEMFLQIRMAFKERQMALVRDTVKIVDLGDKAMPVLPEDFDRFQRQTAIAHIRMKAPFENPTLAEFGQIFFQIGDDCISLLRRKFRAGKILSAQSHNALLTLARPTKRYIDCLWP